MTNASSPVKTSVRISARRLGTLLGWRDVLAVVQDSTERSWLVGLLRHAGFSVDDFANINKAREIVCNGLTRIEDRLEPRHGKLVTSGRHALRDVRRRLELELYP